MKNILGVDPGLNGGLVVINADGEIVAKTVVPIFDGKRKEYDIKSIEAFIRQNNVGLAVLEKSTTRPLQSAQSTFTTGKGFGMYWAIFHVMGIKLALVSPQVWQKAIIQSPKGESKQYAMLYCARTWPREEWRATPRSKNPHDGLCDAACLAAYGLQHTKPSA